MRDALLRWSLTRRRLPALAWWLVGCLLPLVGCGGGYQLRGKVIEGPIAQVLVVDADDPRFREADSSGAGALVWGVFEPDNGIDRQRLERVVADHEGHFVIPLDATGAGFLMYEIQLTARRDGHQGARGVVPVPGRGGRVLITLPRGADTLGNEEDYLGETLRDAQPYLDGRR